MLGQLIIYVEENEIGSLPHPPAIKITSGTSKPNAKITILLLYTLKENIGYFYNLRIIRINHIGFLRGFTSLNKKFALRHHKKVKLKATD